MRQPTLDGGPAPRIAFATRAENPSAPVTIHVNFGIIAGREATLAEIDRLAGMLLERVDRVTVVSEVRHEIDRHSEAAVHQIRVEVAPEEVPGRAVLESWLLDQAERWARRCTIERAGGGIPASSAF